MKATRDALGDILPEMGEKYDNLIAMSADLGGATKIKKFQDKFPDRYFDVGIAENNMIGIASGLSEHGFKVFLSSFGSFLTGKYDTIRCSLCYSGCKNVVLVGTHTGMAIGKDGVTQMAIEDVSIMRALPNMKILNPASYSEAVEAIKYLCETELDCPHYLRLGRQPVDDVMENRSFVFGQGEYVTKSSCDDITIFSTGCILADVMKAAEIIENEGIHVRVVNMHTLKPIDTDIIRRCALDTQRLFSVEDHTIVGGFGSIIAETLSDIDSTRGVKRIGLNDVFPESGPPDKLYDKYGLSAEKIAQKVLDNCRGCIIRKEIVY